MKGSGKPVRSKMSYFPGLSFSAFRFEDSSRYPKSPLKKAFVSKPSSHQDFLNTATHYYWRREVAENELAYAIKTGEYPGYSVICETDSRTGKFKKVAVIPDWNVKEIQLID